MGDRLIKHKNGNYSIVSETGRNRYELLNSPKEVFAEYLWIKFKKELPPDVAEELTKEDILWVIGEIDKEGMKRNGTYEIQNW
jgi:hypothetical protein